MRIRCEQQNNGNDMNKVYALEGKTHYYEPDNGTRYTITAIRSPSKPSYFMFMLDYWQTFMYVYEGEVPHHSYIQDKLNITQGDAIPLRDFFKTFWENSSSISE